MSGKYYEDLLPGMIIRHSIGRTISEADNMLFCALTLNTQPLHINEAYAATTEFGTRIVNGLLTLSLVVGISVPDLTDGTLIANLGYERISHPAPVFHGDTITAQTTIDAARLSSSRPNAGIITMTHTGHNQHGTVVVQVTRAALMLRRPA